MAVLNEGPPGVQRDVHGHYSAMPQAGSVPSVGIPAFGTSLPMSLGVGTTTLVGQESALPSALEGVLHSLQSAIMANVQSNKEMTGWLSQMVQLSGARTSAGVGAMAVSGKVPLLSVVPASMPTSAGVSVPTSSLPMSGESGATGEGGKSGKSPLKQKIENLAMGAIGGEELEKHEEGEGGGGKSGVHHQSIRDVTVGAKHSGPSPTGVSVPVLYDSRKENVGGAWDKVFAPGQSWQNTGRGVVSNIIGGALSRFGTGGTDHHIIPEMGGIRYGGVRVHGMPSTAEAITDESNLGDEILNVPHEGPVYKDNAHPGKLLVNHNGSTYKLNQMRQGEAQFVDHQNIGSHARDIAADASVSISKGASPLSSIMGALPTELKMGAAAVTATLGFAKSAVTMGQRERGENAFYSAITPGSTSPIDFSSNAYKQRMGEQIYEMHNYVGMGSKTAQQIYRAAYEAAPGDASVRKQFMGSAATLYSGYGMSPQESISDLNKALESGNRNLDVFAETLRKVSDNAKSAGENADVYRQQFMANYQSYLGQNLPATTAQGLAYSQSLTQGAWGAMGQPDMSGMSNNPTALAMYSNSRNISPVAASADLLGPNGVSTNLKMQQATLSQVLAMLLGPSKQNVDQYADSHGLTKGEQHIADEKWLAFTKYAINQSGKDASVWEGLLQQVSFTSSQGQSPPTELLFTLYAPKQSPKDREKALAQTSKPMAPGVATTSGGSNDILGSIAITGSNAMGEVRSAASSLARDAFGGPFGMAGKKGGAGKAKQAAPKQSADYVDRMTKIYGAGDYTDPTHHYTTRGNSGAARDRNKILNDIDSAGGKDNAVYEALAGHSPLPSANVADDDVFDLPDPKNKGKYIEVNHSDLINNDDLVFQAVEHPYDVKIVSGTHATQTLGDVAMPGANKNDYVSPVAKSDVKGLTDKAANHKQLTQISDSQYKSGSGGALAGNAASGSKKGGGGTVTITAMPWLQKIFKFTPSGNVNMENIPQSGTNTAVNNAQGN